MPPDRRLNRHTLSPLVLALAVSFSFAAFLSAIPAEAAGDAIGPRGKHGASKKSGKREKALLNMVEKPSFPNEDVERKALVVAPKIPTTPRTRGRRRAAPPPPTPGTLSATGEIVTAPPAPPPAEETTPTPEAAPAPAPAHVPKEPEKPQVVTAETAERIDSIIDKAFVAPPPDAPPTRVEEAPTQLAPHKIAAAMKPVSTAVKKTCPFGERGVVVLRFEVGIGGRIDNVTPEGPLANRPETACVIEAAKKAKLTGASQTSFRYPFPVK